jgi:hypothetical protein
MGFLTDICDRLAAEPREPAQLELALPTAPLPRGIPQKAPPPRHYRICDRMLPPSFFYGTVEGSIDANGKFKGETILDADAPPAGTLMRFKWHRFGDDRNTSGSIVVLAELEAFEAWQQRVAEVVYEDKCWRDLVDEATKENAARDFNLSLGIPVTWQPAQKIALNALYEGNGSGARRNSVEHLQVMEPLIAGRIKRAVGDLLCGASKGSQGLSTGLLSTTARRYFA